MNIGYFFTPDTTGRDTKILSIFMPGNLFVQIILLLSLSLSLSHYIFSSIFSSPEKILQRNFWVHSHGTRDKSEGLESG
jgi:hypothetical protein